MSEAGFADGASRRGLTVLALIVGVAAFVVILYADTFASMASFWQSSGYRHGLIVPPICAYLLWRMRGTLASAELRPSAWGIAVLLAIVALWFVAEAVAVQIVEYLAAVLLIPAAVLAFLGWSVARRASFPLLFLVAAVPVGDGIIPQLMLITADISTALLRAVGVPVFREGQFLSLPGGTFEVASVCAGLSYLTAGTVIALLYSYLTYRSLLRRFVFVAVTAAAVVATNGVRAFIIMYVASATDMRWLTGRDHVMFGWVLFGAVVFGLIYFGMRFAEYPDEDQQVVTGPGVQRAQLLPLILVFGLIMMAATAQPLLVGVGDSWLWLWPATGVLLWTLYKTIDARRGDGSAAAGAVNYRSAQAVLVLAVAPLVLAAGPGLLPPAAAETQVEPVTAELPTVDDCRNAGGWSEGWFPQFHLPDSVAAGSYLCSGRPVNVFVATYAQNAQGRELVNHNNRPVPAELQARAATSTSDFAARDGSVIRVRELQVNEAHGPELVWYWYRAGDATATNPVVVKFRQALDLLLMRQADGTAYVLNTPVDGALDTSRAQLARVARELAAHETLEVHEETVSYERSAN